MAVAGDDDASRGLGSGSRAGQVNQRAVVFACDYGARLPLWIDGLGVRDIPELLGLSDELVVALSEHRAFFDARYRPVDGLDETGSRPQFTEKTKRLRDQLELQLREPYQLAPARG